VSDDDDPSRPDLPFGVSHVNEVARGLARRVRRSGSRTQLLALRGCAVAVVLFFVAVATAALLAALL
jgi:hypothetical protein